MIIHNSPVRIQQPAKVWKGEGGRRPKLTTGKKQIYRGDKLPVQTINNLAGPSFTLDKRPGTAHHSTTESEKRGLNQRWGNTTGLLNHRDPEWITERDGANTTEPLNRRDVEWIREMGATLQYHWITETGSESVRDGAILQNHWITETWSESERWGKQYGTTESQGGGLNQRDGGNTTESLRHGLNHSES